MLKNIQPDKKIFLLWIIISLFVFAFILIFKLVTGTYPLFYVVDTYIFSRIAEAFSKLDFSEDVFFGMSPVYPFFLAPFHLIFGKIISFYILNITCLFFLIFFLYKIFIKFERENNAFFIILLFLINPYIFFLIISGFSELAAYTFLASGIYYMFEKKYITSSVLTSIAVSIRHEFIFILPVLFLIERKNFIKNIFIYIAVILCLYGFINIPTRNTYNPVQTKIIGFMVTLSEYVFENDKDLYLEKLYFNSGEIYEKDKFYSELERFINEKGWKSIVCKYPYYYFLNFINQFIMYLKFSFYIIPFAGVFFWINRKKISIYFLAAFLSPFFIIATVPVETNEYRYFYFSLIFMMYFMVKVLKEKKYLIITSSFLILFSIFFNVQTFGEFKNMNNEILAVKEAGINNKNLITANSWIAYITENKWLMAPPYIDEPEKMNNYFYNENAQYVILDTDYKMKPYPIFYEKLPQMLEKNRYINLINSNPYIFKINASE
ncbi:MAG: hypothetical protein WC002_00995 [Candidatus Muiribacteriota bacterium]